MNKFDQSLSCTLKKIKKWNYFPIVDAVILFGSCARKTNTSDSDIDLCIRVSEKIPAKEIRAFKSVCVPDDINLPFVDIKIDIAGHYDNNDLLHQEIERDGKILWKRE